MKKLLVILLLVNLNVLYSQEIENTNTVKEFALKTSDIQTLKQFDWNKVKDIFKDNKATDSIKISISYVKKENADGTHPEFDNIETTVKGQQSDLNELIKTAKKLAKQIVKSEKDARKSEKRRS